MEGLLIDVNNTDFREFEIFSDIIEELQEIQRKVNAQKSEITGSKQHKE